MRKSTAGFGIVQATPASRVSPGGTRTLPGATKLSKLLTEISESVHVNIATSHELVDQLPRPRGKTVDSTPTAQEAVARKMTCCSFHPAKCDDTT